jgi:hypothetical protein
MLATGESEPFFFSRPSAEQTFLCYGGIVESKAVTRAASGPSPIKYLDDALLKVRSKFDPSIFAFKEICLKT